MHVCMYVCVRAHTRVRVCVLVSARVWYLYVGFGLGCVRRDALFDFQNFRYTFLNRGLV